jgi:hypothetical protein
MNKIKGKKYLVNKNKFVLISVVLCFVFVDYAFGAVATGNACSSETCKGISCWDGMKYIAGRKTQNCFDEEIENAKNNIAPTCAVSFSPSSITAPGIASLSWDSYGADKLIGSCIGPVQLIKADYGLNYAGYPFSFSAAQIGEQICTFVPFNNGVAGTACSASVFISNKNGNEETVVPIENVCQPNDPDCAKSTCKDVYCYDGCVRQRGTRECTGR